MGFRIQDAAMKKTIALPAAAGHVETDPLDLQSTDQDFLANCEIKASLALLDATELPTDETVIVDIEESDDDITYVTLFTAVVTLLGGYSGGAAAASKQLRLPVDVKRYVRAKATGSASIGDCTAKELELAMLF